MDLVPPAAAPLTPAVASFPHRHAIQIRIPRIAVLRRLLRAHPRLRRLLIGVAAVCVLFLGVVVWLLFPYLRTFGDIGAGPGERAVAALWRGRRRSASATRGRPRRSRRSSRRSSYRAYDGEALPNGRYRASGEGDDAVALRLRRHMTPQGPVPASSCSSSSGRGRSPRLREDGRPVERAELEAPGARHLLRRRFAGEVAGAGQGPPRARDPGRARGRGRRLLLAPRASRPPASCAPCSSISGTAG